VKAQVRLKPGSENMFCRARRVPLSMEAEVNKKLEELEQKGIIEKCTSIGIENASPVVWVRKRNGSLRMCPDYKVHLNKKIYTDDYPLPTSESIFSKLSNSKYFASIDLKDAYWQVKIDESQARYVLLTQAKDCIK